MCTSKRILADSPWRSSVVHQPAEEAHNCSGADILAELQGAPTLAAYQSGADICHTSKHVWT